MALFCNVLCAQQSAFDIQGHRGLRGYYPENSIIGFCKAIEMGVTTIELDVLVSKDSQVVVSHDYSLNNSICSGPNGEKISGGKESVYGLYQMDYDEIRKCDCGSYGNSRFPDQVKIASHIPTLEETFTSLENYIRQYNYPEVRYNIEIKSFEKGDEKAHPKPEVFVKLVAELIQKYGLEDRAYIQSFDPRIMEYIHVNYAKIQTSLLLGFELNPIKTVEELSFKPNYISPHYKLISKNLVSYCKKEGIKLVPWTVNENSAIKKMIKLGVDGLITDYPDRAIEQLKIKKGPQ